MNGQRPLYCTSIFNVQYVWVRVCTHLSETEDRLFPFEACDHKVLRLQSSFVHLVSHVHPCMYAVDLHVNSEIIIKTIRELGSKGLSQRKAPGDCALIRKLHCEQTNWATSEFISIFVYVRVCRCVSSHCTSLKMQLWKQSLIDSEGMGTPRRQIMRQNDSATYCWGEWLYSQRES